MNLLAEAAAEAGHNVDLRCTSDMCQNWSRALQQQQRDHIG